MIFFRKRGINRSMDWLTFSLYLGLVFVGYMMIYAVSFDDIREMGLMRSPAGKQVIWIGISFAVFAVFQVIDWKFWQTFAYPVYGFTLLLLVAVLIFGVNINGATSWFRFGGFTIQPSEFAKFGAALAMAAYLSTYKVDLRSWSQKGTALAIFLVPAMLILLQPDAGSALVFMSFLLVLYREGLNPSYYWGGAFLTLSLILGLLISPVSMFIGLILIGLFVLIAQLEKKSFWYFGAGMITVGTIYLYQTGDYYTEILIVLASAYLVLLMVLYRRKVRQMMFPVTIAILIGGGVAYAANYAFNQVLQPHQQDRIQVWLQPNEADKQGSYYNIMQSKLAISSGGLTGRGFLKGNMTKLNYVPMQSTDFIFCTVGEEQGFTGVLALVILFLMFLFRILKLAERQRSDFARIYAYGLLGILFIHFFINIGMTMGIMPVIGIPLPFISKGGSSLLGFTIMISVLLRMDKYRFRL